MTGVAPALDTSLLAVAPASTPAQQPPQPTNQLFNQLLAAMQGATGSVPVGIANAPPAALPVLTEGALAAVTAAGGDGKGLPQAGNVLPLQTDSALAQLLRQMAPGEVAAVAAQLKPGLERDITPDTESSEAAAPMPTPTPSIAPLQLATGPAEVAHLAPSVPAIPVAPQGLRSAEGALPLATTPPTVSAAAPNAGGMPDPQPEIQPQMASAAVPENDVAGDSESAEGSAPTTRAPAEKSAVFTQLFSELQHNPPGAARSNDVSQSITSGAVSATSPQTASFQPPAPATTELRIVQHAINDPAWSEAFGNRVTWMTQNGVQSASVQLTPEHLGPIQVRVTMGERGASIEFHTHHATTSDLIQHSLPRLAAALEAQGIRLEDARVSNSLPQSDGSAGQHAQQGDGRSASQQGMTAHPPGEVWLSETLLVPLEGEGGQGVVLQGVDYYA